MTDELYRAIAKAPRGYVEAPAGSGKTEAIVRTVAQYCAARQLVLTHTHAGVDALTRRFREHRVPAAKYHVDTIAGWAWAWVRNYPQIALYPGSRDIAAWEEIYPAAARLIQKDFVRRGIRNSYAGIIVDEYQDCTVPMHGLIVALADILPCRVLGDELQGVFDFGAEPLVDWTAVRAAFANELGGLETPHRWIRAGNERLGRWLMQARPFFREGREPDYRGSPIARQFVGGRDIAARLIRLTHEKQGRICIISPKARALARGIETTLVNHS